MVMWSLGSLSDALAQSRHPLFDVLVACASTRVPELSAQGLSNVLWSCAAVHKDCATESARTATSVKQN
eukprot:Skav236409  [mRNA]  locus=scaffold1702:217241:217447:- [translate_table: standard]